MAYFTCPACKARQGLFKVVDDGNDDVGEPGACRNCGFPFMFELPPGFHAAEATGFVLASSEGEILGIGYDAVQLTGFEEEEVVGKDVFAALNFSDPAPLKAVLESGGEKIDVRMTIKTKDGEDTNVIIDAFQADREVGGLLMALTPDSTAANAGLIFHDASETPTGLDAETAERLGIGSADDDAPATVEAEAEAEPDAEPVAE